MRRTAAALAIGILLFAAGCGGKDKTPTTTPTLGHDLSVELKEFKVTPTPTSVAAGSVNVTAKNAGTIPHEFVVFKTDLAPDKLPLKGTIVDEEGAGLTHVDEIAEFPAGTTQTKSFTLTAGKYVLICNVATHYQSGMHAALTVV